MSQDRDQWLLARRAALGGSDLGQIPAIVAACGGDPSVDCSPWGSEWHVWSSKVHEPERSALPVNEDMQIGIWLETPILQWMHTAMGGGTMRINPGMQSHPTVPLQGTPDALLEKNGQVYGLEAKVSWASQPWEQVPLHYELQVRAYMAVFDLPAWTIGVFFRNAPARRVYVVERDMDLEAELLEAVGVWWQKRIVLGQPPPIDDTDDCNRALNVMHPRRAGATVADFRIATPDEVRLARDVAQLEAIAKNVERDLARAKNALRAAVGDAPGIRWTGGTARWSGNNSIKIRED